MNNSFGIDHSKGPALPTFRAVLDLPLLADIDNHLLGRLLPRLDLAAGEAEFLDEVPSETSPAERRFLRQFMTHLWDGTGDVIEIGPLFGGTTRALGQGMIHHPQRRDNHFTTVDRFDAYYDGKKLLETLGPILAKKGLLEQIRPHLERGSFVEAFRALHGPTPYGPILRTIQGALPDRPTDPCPTNLMQLASATADLAVLFVDGCKSWYSVKALFRLFGSKLRAGGYVLFQDYGWYTCFWIPVFCAHFEHLFQPIARCEGTYAFRYRGGLTDTNLASFPDQPADWRASQFDTVFARLIERAHDEGNTYGLTHYPLQWAAALATVGEKPRAADIIERCLLHPASRRHQQIIAQCRRQPTYTPDGPVMLAPDQPTSKPAPSTIAAIRLAADGIQLDISCGGCKKRFPSTQTTLAGIPLAKHKCPACGQETIIGPNDFDDAASKLLASSSLEEMVALTNEASRVTEHWYRPSPLKEVLTFHGVSLGEAAERFIAPVVTAALLQAVHHQGRAA